MISYEKSLLINSRILSKNSKLIYPVQNFVDLIWRGKPAKPLNKVYVQSIEFTGKEAASKLSELREWIRQQPPDKSYPSKITGPTDVPVATLVTSLSCIGMIYFLSSLSSAFAHTWPLAYILNLRGSDIPYNPSFYAYLFVGLDHAILFLEPEKLVPEVIDYLNSIGVEQQGYNDIWTFLRRRSWGDGRILIAPQTSQAISLMLTSFRYTVAPSYVEHMMSIKNETEVECMKQAYLRDGVSFVRFLAWLETKIAEGYDITEYDAARRLAWYRRKNKNFTGSVYENISATGANAALPHYSPKKSTAAVISREFPYLKYAVFVSAFNISKRSISCSASGGQYCDGACDTTRTMHFGRPTPEMCETYTRILQGHVRFIILYPSQMCFTGFFK